MLIRLFAAISLLTALGSAIHAEPLVYSLSGYFSGTLGESYFTNDFGTFTEVADSSTVTRIAPGFYQNAGSVTFSLSGYAPVNFDTTSLGVESEYDTASFYDLDDGFAVGLYSAALGAYDLTTPISPKVGFFVSTGPTAEYSSNGYLSITGASGDLIFSAEPSTTQVTPEPSSLLLLSTGLLGAAAAVRRRIRRA